MNRVHPVKVLRIKKRLLNNEKIKPAMMKEGYAEATANKGAHNKVIKEALGKIEEDFKLSDITPESVLSNLNEIKRLAIAKGDLATAKGCEELSGRYLNIFKEHKVLEHKLPQGSDRLLQGLTLEN